MTNDVTQEGATDRTVGDGISLLDRRWSFAGETSDNFDAHVSKSVPLYAEGHDLIEELSEFFVGPDSLAYDLGCSTGAITERLARRHAHRGARVIGIDCEADMIEQTRSRCQGLPNAESHVDNIIGMSWQPTDFIVMAYTLQFVPPKARQTVLDAAYQALNWAGALLTFEKVRAPDARFPGHDEPALHRVQTRRGLQRREHPCEVAQPEERVGALLHPGKPGSPAPGRVRGRDVGPEVRVFRGIPSHQVSRPVQTFGGNSA